MDGEGLVGLNNIHLKLKVNRAAAPQRNSMANTRNGEEYRDFLFIYSILTGERKHG